MKVTIISVGKKHAGFVQDGIELYSKRVNRYADLEWHLIPPIALQGPGAAQGESERILRALQPDDYVILLDETGRQLGSQDFAHFFEQRQVQATKRVILVIGGAYGVTGDVKQRADFVMSLGPLVMPHQLVRLVLAEQLYRAFTIIRGEPYHHA